MATPLEKYLAQHAEPEIALADALPAFERVLCVPACAEDAAFLADLAPALDASVLTIIVVNGADGDEHAATVNARTLSELARLPQTTPRLVIDRASPGRRVPEKQAVGLARKIAADVACALFAQGKLGSRWIHMTDCDVQPSADYFAVAEDDAVLLTYPFRHVATGEQAIDEAHDIYDAFLRYYVEGLRAAGSPYALHTIGSTLAADVHAYAAVRGMPRRQAAEDFYFVNKIAKLGRVVTPNTKPLAIRARRSLRVPFGTGRSTAQIADEGGRAFYHPVVFELLSAWLHGLEQLVADDVSPVDAALVGVQRSEHRAILGDALMAMDAEPRLRRALAAAPAHIAARRSRAHEHFDAFRTRKLVHLLRDGGIPDLPWREALGSASFIDVDPQATTSHISAVLANSHDGPYAPDDGES